MVNQEYILALIKAKKVREARFLIDKNINSKALCYYFHGLCCCSEDKFKNAVFYFRLSNISGFSHYLLYYNLGVAFLEMMNYKNALKNFQKSISINKYFTKNYVNIAYIYSKRNDIKSAYRSIKTGLAVNDCSELRELETKLRSILLV